MEPKTSALQDLVRRAGLDYGLFERVEEARAWLQDRVPQPARLRVIGDDDSDGINSAYILKTALRRAGYEVDAGTMPIHSEADANRALKSGWDAYLIADSGSNLIPYLDSFHVPVLVLDHHRVHGHHPADVFEVNPRQVGGDRVRHVSASIVSLLFALALDERNWDLSFSALAGAVSDRQHLGGLDGLVGYAVDGGAQAGILRRSEGFTLVGTTVLEAITDSLDPYFRAFTGNPGATKAFLEAHRIGPGEDPLMLGLEASRQLAEELTRRLQAHHLVLDRMHPLFGERLPMRHSSGVPTIFALAQLLEAATAERAHEVGLRLLSGAVDARDEAEKLARHRLKRIVREIERLRSNVHELPNLRWAETLDDANTGVYAHTLLTYVYGDDRPFLIASRRNHLAKFSGRGSPRLFLAGVDLSLGMGEVAQALGGQGGGHPGAAGATVAREQRDDFLSRLNERLGELRRRPGA